MIPISICVIMKNEEAFLDGFLSSVNNAFRSYPHEIVIVDTGSVDSSIDIARKHGIEPYSSEWKNDFSSFYNWSMKNGYKENLTIDRIDVNGNYEPSNCRWATSLVQANNQRRNHYITYKGKTQSLADWARELGISYTVLRARINVYSWSIEKSFTTPVNKSK